MKILLSIFIFIFLYANSEAQTVGERVNQKVKDRANTKTDQSIDKGLDKAEEAVGSIFKKKEKKPKAPEESVAKNKTGTGNNSTNQPVKISEVGAQVTSFSDFMPGANVVFFDNFQHDALADFPAKWNTNGSGKVVTIDGQEGRWFDIVHASVVNPVLEQALPENCTIEFDLFLQVQGERLTPYINFGLTPVKDVMREDLAYKEKFFVGINRYNENDAKTVEYGLKEVVGNKNDFPLPSYLNKILHMSMALNKSFDLDKI